MKKIYKSIKLIALLVACLAIPYLAGAQVVKNMYFNVDWQINSPFSQDFSDKTSGWGAHAEAGYYVIPNFSVGAFMSYHTNNKFQPYAGVQLGASYSEMSTYINVMKVYDRNWGFYVSPEIGMTMYFTPQKQIGLHVAAYYNYATNKGEVLSYSIDGLNNWGIRLGLAF